MIKKYNFENPANKELMAEILSKRDRQPRSFFLSSLAAVMVAAVSLTMVFGSLPTSAAPLEEPERQPIASSVTGGETLPPEEVTRVHTETKTETVTVYNDTPQLSEALANPETVSAKSAFTAKSPVTDKTPAEGKSLFNQKQQLFQWQYNGEIFTFFVKDNTVYRRSETTGNTVAVFKGEREVSLFCLNDRYLFFNEETTVERIMYNAENICYCYRVDLLTGEMLRLFSYYPENEANKTEYFVRFDGNDVVFSYHIVHEDGSYEYYYENLMSKLYTDLISYDSINQFIDLENYTIFAEDNYGNSYNLGISDDYIESLGYHAFDDINNNALINTYKTGYKYIEIYFSPDENNKNTNKNLWYYARITDKGLEGGLIQTEFLNQSDLSYYYEFKHTDLGVVYDSGKKRFNAPINFDKLTAPTTSKTEYYYSDDGTGIAITYLPCKITHAATPDSAD